MKISGCCIINARLWYKDCGGLGAGHGITWCRSVDPETACVFLGQTSGERKKKICNHLEQPLSQPLSYSLACFSVYNRVCVILRSFAILLRIKGLEPPPTLQLMCKFKNPSCRASLSLQSYCLPVTLFQKVSSVERQQQKLDFAFAALAHPD